LQSVSFIFSVGVISNVLSDEYIKECSCLGILYYLYSKKYSSNKNEYIKCNTSQCSFIRENTPNGRFIYLYNCYNIFNSLDIYSKNNINSIIPLNKNQYNLFELSKLIWENITKDGKKNISEYIKKLVRQYVSGTNKPVAYLEESLQLPYLLQELFDTININIILIDFHKKENIYDSINIHSRVGGRYVDKHTKFGFIIADGPHTNIIYNRLFSLHEIPEEMMPIFCKYLEIS
jgi:hypothetical protein